MKDTQAQKQASNIIPAVQDSVCLKFYKYLTSWTTTKPILYHITHNKNTILELGYKSLEERQQVYHAFSKPARHFSSKLWSAVIPKFWLQIRAHQQRLLNQPTSSIVGCLQLTDKAYRTNTHSLEAATNLMQNMTTLCHYTTVTIIITCSSKSLSLPITTSTTIMIMCCHQPLSGEWVFTFNWVPTNPTGKWREKVIGVDYASFSPIIPSVTGGCSKSTDTFMKRWPR